MTNDDDALSLIELTREWEREFASLAEDFRAGGDDRYMHAVADFDAYLLALRDGARGVGLSPGRVAFDTFFLVRERRLLGRSTLRRQLTPELEIEGGHIGYDIRPSDRRRGYGTRLLALTLERARARGLERVLVTCDTDNIASARIIEKNGGALAGQAISHRSGKPVSQYWIELPPDTRH